MKFPVYHVDAFTQQVFGGNPAAVCPLESWLSVETMQAIAAEHNLSETAFFVATAPGHYQLRWFTPQVEVDLCGHATLASAFVIFSSMAPQLDRITFETASGVLKVERRGTLLVMDFPSRRPHPAALSPLLGQALGREPRETWKSRDYLLLFEDEETIRSLQPDFDALKRIPDTLGFIVTAPGNTVDFVSRFFAPGAGIAEDPVTGSAHSTLIPFWADRLGRTTLHARQISPRSGELFCENLIDRVLIGGHCVFFSQGMITL
ncbi:phenazine biosynthesis protein PhzF family [Desulfurispirillum indicum S5]|uniref:Phenazine biosynthesis protein PhzF family n=1 Tax=Desulfurispirillum indicum (strain ATCC BAA-1389 / DSM 22839 / S5) TaxID=653733 RepID=E6W1J4_DESIS|nr:PhzF family phenazine biosynthesis protein [Desulfurispirillum indicum]ADU66543.1 phenazine biosynthesis protein PhzF family [Desulfurispirillum indicum S5]